VTCLTSQSLPLKNGDRENTLKTSDQASYVEPEIESSPFPKSSYKEVALSPDSEQNSETGEDGNQWQSIGCDLDTQQLSNTATSCDETFKPLGEWHPNNDCPHMQSSETNRKYTKSGYSSLVTFHRPLKLTLWSHSSIIA